MSIGNPDETLSDIGVRLKAARLRQRLKLSEVARAAGLSESAMSRIEHGTIAASVTNLMQICLALQMTISELFEEEQGEMRTRVRVHRDGDETLKQVESTGYRWQLLAGGAQEDSFSVFLLILPETERMKTLVSHRGQEHCLVLQGAVNFYVAEECHRLLKGDGILIDSELPHRAERIGREPAKLMMTVTHGTAGTLPPEWWNLPEVNVRQHRPAPGDVGRNDPEPPVHPAGKPASSTVRATRRPRQEAP